MDQFYKKIGPRRLQMVRINRTVPLYGGHDNQGIPMANWSLDGVIELIQKYYHQMRFTTERGWSTHSPHVMLTNKATRFAQTEYNRLMSKGDKDEKFNGMSDGLDPNNHRSKTTVNCRAKEHQAIANYLNILELAKEIPGRKYSKRECIEALGKVEVRLAEEDEDARARRRMEEARSEDEGVMAMIIDELFDNAEKNKDDSNSERPHLDLSVELDAANIARDGEEREHHDENNENEEDTNNERVENNNGTVRNEHIIVATTQRPLKVRLANVNELCFKDLSLEGRKVMEKRNPEVTRHNRQERLYRKMNFYATVHGNLDGSNEGDDVFENAFDRLINN